MEVLVFGDSDSAGSLTGGQSWVQRVEAAVQGSEPVTFRSVGFSAVPVGAAAFAERKVRELSPDLVILPVGAFGFTFGFVGVRIERLFGKRVARWSKRIEREVDGRGRGAGGAPRRLNRIGRRVVRRLIGTDAMTTREQLTANYKEIFRSLARVENTDVIAMTYPGIAHGSHRRGTKEQRRAFFAELKPVAEAHHYTWVSTERLFDDLPDWHLYAIDELHFNSLGHERIANLMQAALLTKLPPRG